jgi:hypothetical protein
VQHIQDGNTLYGNSLISDKWVVSLDYEGYTLNCGFGRMSKQSITRPLVKIQLNFHIGWEQTFPPQYSVANLFYRLK